ncbi:hypothetical protein DdX_19650 [Ditylenchus destructor]|uniref:F-box associated domain-containing protein n=1 Tax=Ditylenchus destructor TaxID=166010 RepID=A0AAD4QU32_9BILA|nr:hypothetical protein DdX_19650 [Ditylenchus destructor]
MYPVLSIVLSISTFSATLAQCFKKRAKKPALVLEQAKPEQPMNRKSQANVPTCPFHFGLFYSILTCFDRRELCQLRNVDRRHYIVIENKFGTTHPYLLFDEQYLSSYSWKWQPAPGQSDEEMPSEVRDQLPVSKFVRFKSNGLMVYHPSESAIDVLSISHVWENQDLSLSCTSWENQELILRCASNFEWNEEWACMMATAKYLDVFDGQGSISFLRQFTSGNCVRFSITDLTNALERVELPWNHILEFLFQSNPKDTKSIHICAIDPCNRHQVEILDFLQQVKQKFLNSPDSVHFTFAWKSMEIDGLSIFYDFDAAVFQEFIVQNRRTQQRLRFHSSFQEFRLAVEEQD